MGCLRISYSAEESPLRVSREEENVPENWQVWVAESPAKKVKEAVDQSSGGNGNVFSEDDLFGLSFQDKVAHPGTINLKNSSNSQVAVHLLKGLRYHTKTDTKIDLVKLFDCLDNNCLMNIGTHHSGKTSLNFGGESIPLNFDIPNHGPIEGLRNFDSYGYRTHYSGDGLWNLSYGQLGLSITVPRKHEDLIGKYIGIY